MDPYSSVLPSYHRPPPPHLSRETDPSAAYPLPSFAPPPPRREQPPSAVTSSYYYRQQQQQQQPTTTYGDRSHAPDGRQTYLPVAAAAAGSSRRRSRSPAYRSEQISVASVGRPSRDYPTQRYSPAAAAERYPAYLPSTSRFAETYATDAAPSYRELDRHHYPSAPSASRPTSVHRQQQQAALLPYPDDVDSRSAAPYASSAYHPSYDMPRAAAASTTGSATTVASSRCVPPDRRNSMALRLALLVEAPAAETLLFSSSSSRTRRKQDVASSSVATSASLRTLPSTTRTPRAHGSTVSTSSAVGYKVEKHQLPTGDVRDVIILEDTPPPSGRTRAKAQAAAASSNGGSYRQPVASGSSASYQQALPPPSTGGTSRKRKAEEPGASVAKASRTTANGTVRRVSLLSDSLDQRSALTRLALPPCPVVEDDDDRRTTSAAQGAAVRRRRGPLHHQHGRHCTRSLYVARR